MRRTISAKVMLMTSNIPLASHLPPDYVATRKLRIAAYHDQLYFDHPSCYSLAEYLHAHLHPEALQKQNRKVNHFIWSTINK